ncbi:UDP-N-acetylglucosamine--N-acetylmuramyl-(pentapeptide) pyrophosphoryl-undecaprenol N-acetylglucosamine transferase [Candidatus Saccharibacteria bacterium]|nr:UDP-N-acetylglucosamine--N-acetylmuramyl-(pentapeptide) pyrophosphoryl-undecaprenol N-acetylglucosamine transferase [Candidatus Saccharibacteria bacterium]
MKILVVGGGSGGHITPAVAVVRELMHLRPRTRVEFWTDRKYYKNVVNITTEIGVSWGEEQKGGTAKTPYIRVRKVMSGKFRRYNWTLKEYFENFGIFLKEIIWGNIKGFFGFFCGMIQSFFRLLPRKSRPDVIFLKGGFVGLPVGLAARLLRIPYVVHESDAVPGLANRLLMRKATVVAWGLEPTPKAKEEDKSPAPDNYRFVGIPVAEEFKKVSKTKQAELKKTFGFDVDKPLVVVTGGSQGAEHINEAVREILPELLKFASVGLVAGRAHYENMVDLKKYEEWDKAKLQSNFRLWNFSPVMNEIMGAADVVVSRAGATTIAELAALGKAVVLIPFEKLPGGHQVKNAERLEAEDAVVVVRDDKMVKKPELLLEAVQNLVRSPKKRTNLAKALHGMVKQGAARELAEILIKVGSDEDK